MPTEIDVETLVRHNQADLEDVRLHYAEAGDGPVVVLLHGFPDFWYSWRHQIPVLAEAGYRVIAPDMRGYNLSDKPPGVSPYSIEHLTRDVDQLLDHLGVPTATVGGHDWGAIVAWFFAMWHPQRLDRLMILNVPHPATAARGGFNPRQWLKSWYILFFQLPVVPELATSAGDFAALRRFYRDDAVPGTFSSRDIDLYVEAARRSDRLRYPINYYRAMLRRNPLGLRSRLRTIEQPVLVLWGDQDAHIESGLAEPPQEWVPRLELHRFPEASHWVHMDEPVEIGARMLDFLGRKD